MKTDCKHFEWIAEESVSIVAYDRIQVDVSYRPHCSLLGDCPCLSEEDRFCASYELSADKPRPDVVVNAVRH